MRILEPARLINQGSYIRLFDPWKNSLCTCPLKYSFSPYTGCGHRCLYCYATSYIKDHYNPRPKREVLKVLRRDLGKINKRIIVSISNSSDPYTPPEEKMGITREALELFAKNKVKVLIITKSDVVVRDLDILSLTPSAVTMTITTLDDSVTRRLEPYAPSPDDRLHALSRVCSKVPCGVRIDPLIPGINWDPDMIKELVNKLARIGVKHVSSSTYKARHDSLARLVRSFPDKASMLKYLYLRQGERIGGSYYLPKNYRYKMLSFVCELTLRRGMSFSPCREGFSSLLKAGSCDGSHLITQHPSYKCEK